MANEFSDKFCTACGGGLIATAAICTHCGSPVGAFVDPAQRFYAPVPTKRRLKSTAVLLAVFFSSWAWLYTYKWNAQKFWLTLVGNFVFQIVWFAMNYASYVVSPIFYEVVSIGVILGVHAYAIIDNASVPVEKLNRYPNK